MVKSRSLDELKPGMVVAAPVATQDGRTLCAAGARLAEPTLRRLRALGIRHVDVLDDDAGRPDDAADRVRERFRRALDDPAMAELCEFIVQGLAQSAPSTEPPGQSATDPACVSETAEPREENVGDRFARVSRWLRQATGLGGSTDDG